MLFDKLYQLGMINGSSSYKNNLLSHIILIMILLNHLFGNGLLAYIFTAVAVICGSVVFSVCAKWFLNKIETFLKERVRRVNHV